MRENNYVPYEEHQKYNVISIEGVENSLGGLKILNEGDKYYWGVLNHDRLIVKEIPFSLYREILKLTKEKDLETKEMENEKSSIDYLWNLIPSDTQNMIAKQFNGLEKARELHREEHGNTWDVAMNNYKERGENYVRAHGDFDEYYEEKFK